MYSPHAHDPSGFSKTARKKGDRQEQGKKKGVNAEQKPQIHKRNTGGMLKNAGNTIRLSEFFFVCV